MPRDPREELLWPPADMLDMNVAPELGMEGKSKGEAMERCAPSCSCCCCGRTKVSKGDGGQMDAGGIQGISPLPCSSTSILLVSGGP